MILALSIVLFALSRRTVMFVAGRWDDLAFLLVCAAFAGAILFRFISYADFSPALRITARSIGLFILVQHLFESFGPFVGPPNILFGDGPGVLFFRYGAALAVVAGLLAMWRPAFLVPLFYYYLSWRQLIGKVSGIKVTETDYLGMLDVGYFCVVGVIVGVCLTGSWTLARFPRLQPLVAGTGGPDAMRSRAHGLIWSCAVGSHLGSYFWSGVAKLQAGGREAPWTWLFENPTQISILIGLERGDGPLATWPWALQFAWDTIAGNLLLFNTAVLGAQLLAPLAALSTRAVAFFALLFDVFHIGVYMTLGALFFFWIAINLVIAVAAGRIPRGSYTREMKVVMAATAIFGQYAFYTNYLGWLDGAKLASTHFYAETHDGRQIRIPSNYFGIYSYSIEQGHMHIPDGHFMFRNGGTNLNLKDWNDARSCGPHTLARQNTGVSLAAVRELILRADRFMREYPDVKGMNLYYLYPHHMLPNPWVFTEFNALTIDDIVAYHYVVDSVCLDLKDGRLVRDVRKRTDVRIDLR